MSAGTSNRLLLSLPGYSNGSCSTRSAKAQSHPQLITETVRQVRLQSEQDIQHLNEDRSSLMRESRRVVSFENDSSRTLANPTSITIEKARAWDQAKGGEFPVTIELSTSQKAPTPPPASPQPETSIPAPVSPPSTTSLSPVTTRNRLLDGCMPSAGQERRRSSSCSYSCCGPEGQRRKGLRPEDYKRSIRCHIEHRSICRWGICILIGCSSM